MKYNLKILNLTYHSFILIIRRVCKKKVCFFFKFEMLLEKFQRTFFSELFVIK